VVKGAWSKAEDDRLLRLVEEHGAERWVIIAQHMGSRSGKQCRERWHNHVDPCILRKPFTPEEDAIIIALYNQIGSKWAEMSKRLKGRPDNSIKNHFNTTLSRR
ncbi:C-Myb R2r3, partial [Tilletiopsis washingtonensis]